MSRYQMKPMDSRGVSEALSYATAFLLFTTVLGGATLTTQMFTDQHTAQSTMNQLQQQGELVAGQIQTLDRLVRESNSERTIRTTYRLPKRIAGSYYSIKIYSPSDAASSPNCGAPADAPRVGCIYFDTHQDFDQLSDDQAAYYVLGPSTTVATTTIEPGPIRIEHAGPDSNPINITEGTA